MSQDQKSTTPPLPADSPNSHSPQPEETTLHQPTRSPSPSPTPEPATNGHAVNDDNAATAVETSVAEPNAQLTEVRNGAHDESRPDGAAVESQLGNSRDSLEDFGWEELQERFAKKMEECEKREEELGKEFKEWLEVCMLLLCLCSKACTDGDCSVWRRRDRYRGYHELT